VFHHKRNTRDVSLGGARILSDEAFSAGSRLELDVFLPDGSTVRCWAEVVWLAPLEPGHEARFEVGLKFSDMALEDYQRLATALTRSD